MATKDISDRQVCEAFAAYKQHGLPFADERLRQATGQPDKVLTAAMERAYGRRLIECGVTLRSGWLTDKGRALLADGVPPSDEAQRLIDQRRSIGWADDKIANELRYRGLPTDGVLVVHPSASDAKYPSRSQGAA